MAALLVGGYEALRSSEAFAVQSVGVDGGSPKLRKDVERAARDAIGEASLLGVDRRGVELGVMQIPQVRSAEVDRAFPDLLRIRVVPERPVAQVVLGGRELVIAESGRVLGEAGDSAAALPQISAAPVDLPGVGGRVQSKAVLEQIALTAAPIRPLGIVGVGYGEGGLAAKTRHGYEIRFGDGHDLPRKIATVRAVLRKAPTGTLRYVDVSVPATPVVRAVDDDPRTAFAPPPITASLPPILDIATWIEDVSPRESIRTVFG